MEPIGSDAYRARRLRHMLCKHREAERHPANANNQIDPYLCCHVEVFENLDLEAQVLLIRETEESSEIPVVASYKDSDSWVMVTTRRIIWKSDGKRKKLYFSVMTAADLSYGPWGVASDWIDTDLIQDLRKARIYPTRLARMTTPWLSIIDDAGTRHDIFLASMDKDTVLKSLKFMILLEQIHPRYAPTKSAATVMNHQGVNRCLSAGSTKLKFDPKPIINLAFASLEKKWTNMWNQMNCINLELGPKESAEEGHTTETFRKKKNLLLRIIAELLSQNRELSRIRKSALWSIDLLEPKPQMNLALEYSQVASRIQNALARCNDISSIPKLDYLTEALESSLLDKLRTAVAAGTRRLEQEKLQDAASFLRRRLDVHDLELRACANRRELASQTIYGEEIHRQENRLLKLLQSTRHLIEIIELGVHADEEVFLPCSEQQLEADTNSGSCRCIFWVRSNAKDEYQIEAAIKPQLNEGEIKYKTASKSISKSLNSSEVSLALSLIRDPAFWQLPQVEDWSVQLDGPSWHLECTDGGKKHAVAWKNLAGPVRRIGLGLYRLVHMDSVIEEETVEAKIETRFGPAIIKADDMRWHGVQKYSSFPKDYEILASSLKAPDEPIDLSLDSSLAVYTAGNAIEIWDFEKNKNLSIYSGDTLSAEGLRLQYCTAFSSDGRFLLLPEKSLLFNIHRKIEQFGVREAGNKILIALSPNDRVLATCTSHADGFYSRLTNISESLFIGQVEHDSPVSDLSFSANSKYLATASLDGTVVIVDASTCEHITTLNHAYGPSFTLDRSRVLHLQFSPCSEFIATASSDYSARIWHVLSGKEQCRVEHFGEVYFVDFSPCGKLIITAGTDVLTGTELHRIQHGRFSRLNFVSFCRDSRSIISSGMDGTCRIWDLVSGKEIFRTYSQSLKLKNCRPVLSADRRFLALPAELDETPVISILDICEKAEKFKLAGGLFPLAFGFVQDANPVLESAPDSVPARTVIKESAETLKEIKHSRNTSRCAWILFVLSLFCLASFFSNELLIVRPQVERYYNLSLQRSGPLEFFIPERLLEDLRFDSDDGRVSVAFATQHKAQILLPGGQAIDGTFFVNSADAEKTVEIDFWQNGQRRRVLYKVDFTEATVFRSPHYQLTGTKTAPLPDCLSSVTFAHFTAVYPPVLIWRMLAAILSGLLLVLAVLLKSQMKKLSLAIVLVLISLLILVSTCWMDPSPWGKRLPSGKASSRYGGISYFPLIRQFRN